MAVLSNVSQGPKFVADPVLKAARERQAFSDSQVLANPSFTATDDFISVVGAKALGVALDPETGRMPNVAADEEPRKSLGLCLRVTNKGESGFGKASDRVKAKDHRP